MPSDSQTARPSLLGSSGDPSTSAGSYVYPVRTLLTGIQPVQGTPFFADGALLSPTVEKSLQDVQQLSKSLHEPETQPPSDIQIAAQIPLPSSNPSSENIPDPLATSAATTSPLPAGTESSDDPSVPDTDSLQPGDEMQQNGQSMRSTSLVHLGPIRRPAASSESDETGVTPADSSSRSITSTSDAERYIHTRLEHLQDENGHHVIIGREGKLARCEDEPIRIPGAVQGFGVLIALREDERTGDFRVRQVSENSTELLGLSPKYLFKLECFTLTLPDTQADILADNLRFLTDLDEDPDDSVDESPQVFLLSGYGEPGSAFPDTPEATEDPECRRQWTCWCAIHRPPDRTQPGSPKPLPLIVLEFELERDVFNPLYPTVTEPASQRSGTSSGSFSTSMPSDSTARGSTGSAGKAPSEVALPLMAEGRHELFRGEQPKPGLPGDNTWFPRPEDVFESTTSRSKPLRALERMRRIAIDAAMGGTPDSGSSGRRGRAGTRNRGAMGGVGTMDVFTVLGQVNDQLSSAADLDTFLKIVVGVIKDVTQFHRVLVYQFDEAWNGQCVAELVDWSQTHDLFKGLHFPATDIPAQARELYAINRVRLLYDRAQTTARLVCKTEADLASPLDLTHSYLRAMSPIHLKYLANMGVRASMSISIVTFGKLWGLVACHSYGNSGMRVSFPVRHMLRLLSDSISRNIERLSYAQRLHTRKLVNTLPTEQNPGGYIVSNAEDLLSLFDADFGVLVIGDGAKILGENVHGQEIVILAEYLRLKQFPLMQVTQCLSRDFPDLRLPTGPESVAGLLYVPLSSGGKDFIALLRQGQLKRVHWAGKPFKQGDEAGATLEPRKSFKLWSETIAGHSRPWTDEQLETAGVLALVYGKFIEVWRQKESALQATQLTNLLLSNASHEVRTPLNQIINYLELALNGPLDEDTRENLTRSHTASKSLLFTINDLLDLTKLESGNETSFNEPFDLQFTISEAANLYKNEAARRGLEFRLDTSGSPQMVVGDAQKIRTVVANLIANAVKFTSSGFVSVECRTFEEPAGLRDPTQVAVEIVVEDTGCGISSSKLESIFREFEQVETSAPRSDAYPGLGLGLAVVARIVEQLGGQLRVDSEIDKGSRFSFLIPFVLYDPSMDGGKAISSSSSSFAGPSSHRSRVSALKEEGSGASEVEGVIQALGSVSSSGKSSPDTRAQVVLSLPGDGTFPVADSHIPVRSVKMPDYEVDVPASNAIPQAAKSRSRRKRQPASGKPKLRVLVVEDDPINRKLLLTRLSRDGYSVSAAIHGQEAVDMIEKDRAFDCVLMDIQMPILDGFEATKQIREIETGSGQPSASSSTAGGSETPIPTSLRLNGRIPIFAVSASLRERQREEIRSFGLDGWILKPIDYQRMNTLLRGITDLAQRRQDVYQLGCNWEAGGWLVDPPEGPGLSPEPSPPAKETDSDPTGDRSSTSP